MTRAYQQILMKWNPEVLSTEDGSLFVYKVTLKCRAVREVDVYICQLFQRTVMWRKTERSNNTAGMDGHPYRVNQPPCPKGKGLEGLRHGVEVSAHA